MTFFLSFLLAFALPAEGPAPVPTASATRTLVGEVISVDVPNRKLVVAQALKASDRKGAMQRETLTVHVPFSTRVSRGKKAATLVDVKPRDQAVVRYRVTAQGAQALSLQVADLAGVASATPVPEAPGGS